MKFKYFSSIQIFKKQIFEITLTTKKKKKRREMEREKKKKI